MKNVIVLLMAIILLMKPAIVNAAENTNEFVKIRCTCYTAKSNAVTASGQTVREGIVAGKKEWCNNGYFALIYDMDMHYIGMYEFLDTGAGIDTDGDGVGDSIRNGKSIDIYRDNLDRCKEWTEMYGDYVYIVLLKRGV